MPVAPGRVGARPAEEPTPNRPPAISLPKGGGAIRNIGEKFAADPATGTGSMSIPIEVSQCRSGFGPQLALSYDSGAGQGVFGLGWRLSPPAITRKTDRGVPRYHETGDRDDDVFVLSGAEDLVPELSRHGRDWVRQSGSRTLPDGSTWRVERYRPRVERNFARIERWTDASGNSFWRSLSRDNTTTVYGRTAESRIADPADPHRVYSWLVCETYDDRGNAILYRYASEDSTGVDLAAAHEHNRTPAGRSANRHLKRILYGNRTPRAADEDLRARDDWLFELVLDYGEHHEDVPTPVDAGPWLARRDPFSTYRPGFEVRTYRLCQRLLLFHHFADEPEVGAGCLVRSLDLSYRAQPGDPEGGRRGEALGSFLASVRQCGYRRRGDGGYLRRTLPPLELEYSRATIDPEVREIDAASLENLPRGLEASSTEWVDLDGDGVAGALLRQGHAWWYKPNLSPAMADQGVRLAPLEQVVHVPAGASEPGIRAELLDVEGDGKLDLVELRGPLPGFWERAGEAGWTDFTAFGAVPRLDWDDADLRLSDLTGDGRADVLVCEDGALTWYPSLGGTGFAPGRRVTAGLDDERGPRALFADGTQSLHLADLSGDGLVDLVRVRNGEVCYWPSLGYGRFGAKVCMDGAPVFDSNDQFDPARVRLADHDGSGTADLLYLARDGARLYANESGNAFRTLAALPPLAAGEDERSVAVVDLLGNGTACLVVSSPLADGAAAPVRYLRLLRDGKPHLLVGVRNNLGAETAVRYAPSTRFAVQDRLAGHPWRSRLPFPVHVVERVETRERISDSRFVSRFAYHHGCYDAVEREFRGFALVERWDTEELAALVPPGASAAANEDATSHVPPVLTRTWLHTGMPVEDGILAPSLEGERYREPGLSEAEQRALLPEPVPLPTDVWLADGTRQPIRLSDREAREASRALRGSLLREEVYALDGSQAQARPYSVSERSYAAEVLQPRAGNPHAVFFLHPRETVTFACERALRTVDGRQVADPRVAHSLTLEVDRFGNAVEAASIAYGRRHDDDDPVLEERDHGVQRRALITYAHTAHTNAVEQDDSYRGPLPCDQRTYELLGTPIPGGAALLRPAALRAAIATAADGQHDIAVEDDVVAAAGAPRRRLVGWTRLLYRHDDLAGALPLGELASRALPFERYQLAFTPGLAAALFTRERDGVTEDLLPDRAAVLGTAGGYVSSASLAAAGLFPASDPGDLWWAPSGRVLLSPGESDSPAQELEYARAHFFLPMRFTGPFGVLATVTYDRYDLLVRETRDAGGLTVTAGERDAAGGLAVDGNDYRVLRPRLVMDPNGNRAAVVFDALGQVVGGAVMGKPGEPVGDALDGFEPDLPEAEVLAHRLDPLAAPAGLLGRASTRVLYDLAAFERTRGDPRPAPPAVLTLARETHDADLAADERARISQAVVYADGFGRELQRKVLVEPGPLLPDGPRTEPRWVASGWVMANNKGKPVRAYEPFFSGGHGYEPGRLEGVSRITCYDPLGRPVAGVHPDHTWTKVVVSPWQQVSWDSSDTVADDPRTDLDVGAVLRRLGDAALVPTWRERRTDGSLGAAAQQAASRSAVHARTPGVAFLDPLGRPFLTCAHNRLERNGSMEEERLLTRVVLDVRGAQRELVDELGRVAVRAWYDLLGTCIRQSSMEAGMRLALPDAAGAPLLAWDDRGHVHRTEYDAKRRPVRQFVRGSDPVRSDPRVTGREVCFERIAYGDEHPDRAQALARNLLGRPWRQWDGAGLVTHHAYDFKGNLLAGERQLAVEFQDVLDWSATAAPALEPPSGGWATTYDALGRPLEATTPEGSVTRVGYDEGGVETIDVNLRGEREGGAARWTAFVTSVEHNAKGQRANIVHANGVTTTHAFEPETARLSRLRTVRAGGSAGERVLQDLTYSYDSVGNPTSIEDAAAQVVFYAGAVVTGDRDYRYDALYRLVEARGREHLGQNAPPRPHSYDDRPRTWLPHPADGTALGRYVESYDYDGAGNVLALRHRTTTPAFPGWTRNFSHAAESLLESGWTSNRLTASDAAGGGEAYRYDAHGSMVTMPQLTELRWDHHERLQMTQRQRVGVGDQDGELHAGERTWYTYDSSGRRVRKVTTRQNGTRAKETVYLGAVERYRQYGGDGQTVVLERETLHVLDGKRRVALVETTTVDTSRPQAELPWRLVRYQLSDHLGSSCVEVDEHARVLSQEEYYPFGATAMQAARADIEVPPRRYRHSGAERDEETGLSYARARYYAPWLLRWTSCDPAGPVDGPNLYRYVSGNPIRLADPTGYAGEETDVIAPTVAKLLEGKNIPYAREVTFDLIDEATGNRLLSGRADFVFRDPRSGMLVMPETKGLNLDSLTANQKIYVPLFESEQGAMIRITSTRAGLLNLPAGSTERITGYNFLRVGRSNIKEFASALEEISSGARVRYSFRDASGLRFFKSAEEFDAFLATKGMSRLGAASRLATGLKVVGVAATVASSAAALAEPIVAGQQIDELSSELGYLTGKSAREINRMRDAPGLVQLDDPRFLFDPKSGWLYAFNTDLQAGRDWSQIGRVEQLYRPWTFLDTFAGGAKQQMYFQSSHEDPDEPPRFVVWQDEDNKWRITQPQAPSTLDNLSESARTGWREFSEWLGSW